MANKSQFRLNVETAMRNAGAGRATKASSVFVDRHKCSDRIKFAFTDLASEEQATKIANEVGKFYPDSNINVYDAGTRSYQGYRGIAVSVSHEDNVKL